MKHLLTVILLALGLMLMGAATAHADALDCHDARYREAMKQRSAMPAVRCSDRPGSTVRNFLYVRGGCRVYAQTISSEHTHVFGTRWRIGHKYTYSPITVFNGCTGKFERSIPVR